MMLVLTACPYQSKVPITKPQEKVDKDLLGEWISTQELEIENPKYFSINKFDKTKYEIIEMSYSSYDTAYSSKTYFMHTSTIKDRLFLNVEDASQGGGYYLYYLEKGSNEFTLFEVSDNIDEQFASSEDLRKFVEKHMNLSFFYSKDELKYIRKSKTKK